MPEYCYSDIKIHVDMIWRHLADFLVTTLLNVALFRGASGEGNISRAKRNIK